MKGLRPVVFVHTPSSSLKNLTLVAHAGLFWCFHNPPNSDTDYRIVNLPPLLWSLRMHTHTGGPQFIVSPEGLL